MPKLISFNFISLDGYYKGLNEDISWHKHDPEWSTYATEGLQTGGTLLFGRVTYQMMESYWTMPSVAENDPEVYAGMNQSHKIVFSKTLQKVSWNNTRLIKGTLVEEVTKLKQQPGNDITILGSGTIVTQLAEAGLIDEFQVLVNPVIIGNGTPLFKGLSQRVKLKLTNSRVFGSGNVLLCYQP